MYKFEIHLHTNNCSACAISGPEEIIDIAYEKGYSGIVLTNHFYNGNTAINRKLPWKDFLEPYIEDYEIAKAYGKVKGITVFFGLEEGFAPGKEMLIYGLDPKKLLERPDFVGMQLEEKVEFIHSYGGICVFAHPFRNRQYIPNPDNQPDPQLFDGIEGYNLCNTSEENEKAMVWAINNKKVITSGGDVHRTEGFGKAGIEFSKPIRNYSDFVKRLKKGDFKLITEN